MSYRILVVNPGSTSTKIGVYEDENLLFDKTLRHSAEELEKFDSIPAQKDWRRKLVMKALEDQGFDVKTLSAVSGRGGLLAPIRGGTYAVSDRLVRDCTVGVQGQHASNLGGIIAREIGDQLGIPSFIVDPVVVDELSDVARFAGHPLFHRTSIFHALNQKAVAKRYAKEHGKKYEDLNLIVCHMGGGCSIGAHVHGSVVDTQNALDGDGPFSPERSGSLPTGQLVSLCFSGKYTAGEVRKMLAGHGGLVAYTGSNDMRDLLKAAAEGDKEIAATVDAFHYQIGKEVGAMAAVMKGKVDQIILTGGIDLSVGAVAGICGMVAGALLTNGLPLWNGDILFFNVPEVILCVAIFGVLVGLVNGAVITRFGVAPFICTLGMMYVARGSALLFNDGSTYPNLNGMEALGNTGFATLGSGTLLGVYLPIWLMIGFLVLGYWLTTKTPLGRYIYAIGGNESAARLAGVPIVKAKIFVYAFSGLCAAFVGLIVASQLQTAHPMTGNMFEMDAIGATVLGGTALAGGRGRVTGSIIGAFVIVFLADGMVMMGVSDFWQMVIKGVVIVTAVVVDQFQQKLQSKVILMRRHEEKLAAIPPNGATSS